MHRIKEAVLYKILHPDADVPSAHHELTKYFNPPKVVLERSAEPKDACKTAFQLRYIPPKAHSTKRSRANAALDKEGGATQTQTQDLDLTDAGDTQGRNGGAGRSEGDNGEEGEGSNKKVKLEAESGASDTEEEEDLLSSSKPRASRSASASASASASQAKTRPQRSKAGARTISLENPVADFERLVEGSEDVDQACEAMRETIRELVNESMSTSLYDKARDALSAFRNFSAEVSGCERRKGHL